MSLPPILQDILKLLEEGYKSLPTDAFLETFLIITVALMAFATAFLFSLIFHTRSLMFKVLEDIPSLLERLDKIRSIHRAGKNYIFILNYEKNYVETAVDKFQNYTLTAAILLAFLCIISIGLFGFALVSYCPLLFLYLLLTIQLGTLVFSIIAGWYFKPYKQVNKLRKLIQEIQNYLIGKK